MLLILFLKNKNSCCLSPNPDNPLKLCNLNQITNFSVPVFFH